jgi:hypothetical protein
VCSNLQTLQCHHDNLIISPGLPLQGSSFSLLTVSPPTSSS